MSSEEEIDSTWNEMTRRVKGDGFREGALKGSEEGMASGFDDGYAEGLRLGKAIGAQYGKKQLQRFLNRTNDNPELKKIQSHCEICVRQLVPGGKTAMPDSVEQLSYDELKALQRSRTDKLLQELQDNPLT